MKLYFYETYKQDTCSICRQAQITDKSIEISFFDYKFPPSYETLICMGCYEHFIDLDMTPSLRGQNCYRCDDSFEPSQEYFTVRLRIKDNRVTLAVFHKECFIACSGFVMILKRKSE